VKLLKALILIGGFGTRLRPLSCTRPKALFPIVNKPLLQWTFERLAKSGIDEVILAVNKLTGFHIKQQRIRRYGLKVKFSYDPPKMPLGTAGPIKKAEKLIGNEESFMVLNGDLITEMDYNELVQKHKENDAVATIALHRMEDPSRYGVAEITDENQIKRFTEKPPKGKEPSKLINAGVYVLSPKIFDYIPKGRAVSMEREIFPILAEEKLLYGHEVSGLWIDIGKPEDFLNTNKILLDSTICARRNSKFNLVKPVAVDKNVIIGENSVVGPYTILGKNVSIGKNVKISNSVVFEDAKIDDNACLEGVLIGEAAKIGKNVRISEGCIIADHAKVKDGALLTENVHVCPAKEIT
jgi:NDP-sugar pyrophosphorylase family protein